MLGGGTLRAPPGRPWTAPFFPRTWEHAGHRAHRLNDKSVKINPPFRTKGGDYPWQIYSVHCCPRITLHRMCRTSWAENYSGVLAVATAPRPLAVRLAPARYSGASREDNASGSPCVCEDDQVRSAGASVPPPGRRMLNVRSERAIRRDPSTATFVARVTEVSTSTSFSDERR